MAAPRSTRPSSRRSWGARAGHGRGSERAAGADRRQARPVQGDGRRRAGHRRPSSPSAPARTSATCASGSRSQAASGYVDYDAATRRLRAAARAGARARRRGQPGRSCPARSRSRRRCSRDEPHDRGVPQRRGRRLARARPRPVPRHRALLPPRLPRQPRVRAGSRRSTASRRSSRPARASPTSAAATAPRRSSWPQAYPDSTLRRLRLPRGLDRARARARRARPASPTASRFEVAARQGLPAASGYDLVASSTACTTWATRSAPRAHVRAALAAGRHLDDRRAVRRATASRTTSTRSGACSTRPRRCICTPASLVAGGRRSRSARRPARRGCARCCSEGGFTRVRRAAETPFNLVLEARRSAVAAASVASQRRDALTAARWSSSRCASSSGISTWTAILFLRRSGGSNCHSNTR